MRQEKTISGEAPQWRSKRSRPCASSHQPQVPSWRLGSEPGRFAVDFVLENPLDGKLWESEALQSLTGPFTKRVNTSYCHYGTPYRKRTTFFTSLTNVSLSSPCPGNPCKHATNHEFGVAECEPAVQNSIPTPIVRTFLDEWMAKDALAMKETGREYDHLLLIDVFKGFGSVQKAVGEWNDENEERRILYVGNDIADARVDDADTLNFDISKLGQFEMLIDWSFLKLRQHLARLQDALDDDEPPPLDRGRVRALFWVSTPCDTYGPQGMGYHGRVSGKLSKKAKQHDGMNMLLAKWFQKTALTPYP